MSKVAKAAIGLMIVTIFSKILGFGRELVLGSVYGASYYTDAYIVAIDIPNVLFGTIGTALATTFIPLYYDNLNIGGENRANYFTNNIFNITLILSLLIAIFGSIFAEPLVKLFAIGFEDQTLKLAINFTKIMMWSVIFIGLANIMSSILQIKDKFIITGLIGIPYSIILIFTILLSRKIGIYVLPIGTLVAIMSKFLFQIPFAFKEGYKYKFNIDIKNEHVKKIIYLVGPVFIGVAVNQINTLVDRTLASTLIEGSISALNYANRLNGFVIGLFIMSIGTVIYPTLSKLSTDSIKFSNVIVNAVNSVILLVIPVSIGAIVIAEPIIRFVFERGAFDTEATNMTTVALICYSIGMIGFGLREILNKIFYSLQDTKTPMINGAMAMGMNIILNIIFIKFLGHAGLALATSISALICIVLLFNSLKQKIGYFGQDKIIKTTFKSLISAIIMGIVTYLMYNTLANILGVGFIQEAIALFVSIGIGTIVYGILVITLKVEEVNMITDIIKNKISSKRKI